MTGENSYVSGFILSILSRGPEVLGTRQIRRSAKVPVTPLQNTQAAGPLPTPSRGTATVLAPQETLSSSADLVHRDNRRGDSRHIGQDCRIVPRRDGRERELLPGGPSVDSPSTSAGPLASSHQDCRPLHSTEPGRPARTRLRRRRLPRSPVTSAPLLHPWMRRHRDGCGCADQCEDKCSSR